MEKNQNSFIKGDRAISSGHQDKLGFKEVAKEIATSIVYNSTDDGLVIGLEGTWGSGKSSLISIIREELQNVSKDKRPYVIDFRPWLVGSRDALISSLFIEITKQLETLPSDAESLQYQYVRQAKYVSEALRRFFNGLSRLGDIAEVAGEASGVMTLKWGGRALKAARSAFGGEPALTPLSELKENLARALKQLKQRIVVTVDDVDRLDPSEIAEMLRLVRSVLDLPNITYILCYDIRIISNSIEKSIGVKNGREYLEKIVQVAIMVPRPETFQLRQWFSNELGEFASVKDDDELSRLKSVIDYEGGRQFRTPRSVVRVLDAVRFLWPSLQEAQSDLADLVWLQLIKEGNPNLYRWVEEYCGNAAAASLGTADMDNTDREQALKELLTSVPDGHFTDMMYRHVFASQLPGVEVDYAQDGKLFKLFSRVSDRIMEESIGRSRLASPDHYRLYFALSRASHALSKEEFGRFLAASKEGADQIKSIILGFHEKNAILSLSKADILLERLPHMIRDVLSADQCGKILFSLSQTMDEAYQIRPFELSWVSSLWGRAQALVPLLLLRIEQSSRAEAISAMFSNGAAIGWLTFLFSEEAFNHGRSGDRLRPELEWAFTENEFDVIAGIMLSRYRALTPKMFFKIPQPVNLLFAWRQAGDDDGPKRLVQEGTLSNEGLLSMLEHLSSTVNRSDIGKIKVLREVNVSRFLDYDEAKSRTASLVSDNNYGKRADMLMKMFLEGGRL